MPSVPTRVLIADDNEVVRRGLASLLRATPRLELVGQATNAWEAVTLANELQPDVVLMDLSMPGLDPIDAIGAIHAPRVVVLTLGNDVERRERALAAGAVDFLLKDAEPRDILCAVLLAALADAA